MQRIHELRRHAIALPLVCLALGLVLRLALIQSVPWNFSFDGFQRWAGREHFLVQDWLPLTQSILVLNEWAGGGLESARIVLALVASLGLAMAAWVARRLGASGAGWCFVPLSLFGPALCWTVVPYQEGTYLTLLFGALALAMAARDAPQKKGLRLAADLVIGAAALCRTEGWLLVVLYVLWWRDRESLRSLWGVAVWLAWKWGLGMEPYRSSPVSYADWNGLLARFEASAFLQSSLKHWQHWAVSGGWVLWVAGLAGIRQIYRQRMRDPVLYWGASFLALVGLAQVASTLAWMVGLETATVRMTLIPGVILSIFSASFFANILIRMPRFARPFAVLSLLSLGVFYADDGWTAAHRASRAQRMERRLVVKMAQCDDCYVQVEPRKGLGTRNRHDGCEVIQGISEWHHPEDFYCASWPEPPLREPTHRARVKAKDYVFKVLPVQ